MGEWVGRLTTAMLLSGLLLGPTSTSWASEEESDGRLLLLESMETELERSVSRLEFPGHGAPYFLAYQMTDSEEFAVSGKYGALADSKGGKQRLLFVEARVGDYDLDNTNIGAFDFDPNQVENPYVTYEGPLDDDPEALRHRFWLLTDDKYKEALSAYLRKQGKSVYTVSDQEEEDLPSFSREKATEYIGETLTLTHDAEQWKTDVRQASALLKDYPQIFDGEVSFMAQKVARYYVNSEGTKILDESILYTFHAAAMTRADDGMYLDNTLTRYYREPSNIPTGDELKAQVRKMADDLMALRAAPILEPYTGPAILEAGATGVLFHESVGHRLEGERQNSEEEGQTFKEQVGSAIVPEFLSIIDDPTLETFEGQQLNGFYRFDDEGVPAARVDLVKDGVLKGFLMSRTPVAGHIHSNGHGRTSGLYDPIARMGNFQVLSSRTISNAELKDRLIEESKKAGKPYGLIIRDIEGGSTNTSSYGYQAFKGSPRLVYKVDVETGEETLVRGVEMVGTPLTVISKVLVTGDRSEVFNGYCGAESGYVPVSTIAPAILLGEIELQRTHSEPARLPILTSPREGDDEGGRVKRKGRRRKK